MKRIVVDPQHPREGHVSAAAEVLRVGGVVACPTETFYALAANAMDGEACSRVFRIKGREAGKALPCILASVRQLGLVTESISESVPRLASRFWPGPLTLVVPARHNVAAKAPDGTVAVRVSGLPLARRLSEALGGPITATSANRAGMEPCVTAEEVFGCLDDEVDLVLDGGQSPGGEPSTIVDMGGESPALVRPGAIDYKAVLEVLAVGD